MLSLCRGADKGIRQFTAEHLPGDQSNQIVLKLGPSLPWVEVDPDMVQRAVREFLANAVHARSRQSIQVVILQASDDQAVWIQVIDDGEGMDQHTLDHAADPLFIAHPAGRGAGLGLTRPRQFAAAHGGELQLRSIPGQGTTATLVLPLQSRISTENAEPFQTA